MISIRCRNFQSTAASLPQRNVNRILTRLSALALTGYCLSGITSMAGQVDESVETAHHDFVECQMASIESIDDGRSNAKEIALDLTNHCIDEYENLIKIHARESLDNSNERRMFTIERNADFEKIDVSLPLVKLNRAGELAR